MFELDLRSRVPIYEQLVQKIKEMIIKEVLKENEQLPSVRTLSKELSINPNTIQKAYRELEIQGYIYSIPGKGNYVFPIKKDKNVEKINKLKLEIKKLISEAMYLGMAKDELVSIIDEIENSLKGGKFYD
ncbi:GntR family transcriptional regulator [Caldicellulosiruptoraceae bacterium PP1]